MPHHRPRPRHRHPRGVEAGLVGLFAFGELLQKSTGPTTPEGKAKSALNARRHGYSGASIVIAEEDLDAFNAHLDSYFASFAPQTQAECDTIRRAAIAMWRADRLTSIETGILDIETTHASNMVEVANTTKSTTCSRPPLKAKPRSRSASVTSPPPTATSTAPSAPSTS